MEYRSRGRCRTERQQDPLRVALDVFNRADRQPVTMSIGAAPERRTTSASAVVPEKPGLHYAVLDASDDVVRLAERREPLTAQAPARIN